MGRDVFYITTPIYYPNDVPHIGHAYNAVATDFIARYHRLRGEDVFHLTGTDEHGLKLQRAAEAAGLTPQVWVDDMEPKWKEVWARLDIAYDDYIRTTQARHERAVAKLLTDVYENGRDDIYLGTYEGLYCVSCEAYYTPEELLEGGLCPIHERPVEHVVEQNYFFRLSAYADRLLAHYAEDPSRLEPETRRNEVLSLIRGGLQDFSISRTSFTWGVPLPWDSDHVCYVWFDALSNYITAAGFVDDPDRFARVWPADIHLIGKDILRFHAVYWPAMLMAAGVEPPTQVWAHGFLTVGGKKMSKTNLTGIHPFELIDQFGTDSYRYYFMREMRFGEDGNFSWESMVDRHNADLANGLGNLASRVLAMIGSYFDGVVPEAALEGSASDLPAVTRGRRPPLRRAHARRAAPARPDRGLGHRRAREPVPGGEGAVEARQGRGQPGGARVGPLRVRRDPPDPRGADPADHARSRRAPLGATGHRGAARCAARARRRGVGTARSGHPHDEGWEPLPPRRPRVARPRGFPPRLHSGVRLVLTVFHVKLPGSTRCGDPCKLAARERPEP